MESVGIIALIIAGILFIFCTKNKSKNEEERVTYTPQSERQVINNTQSDQLNDRQFTFSELKQAEAGKYSWDETGCVFEINSDGSVTIVGHFDPAELLIDPDQELYERMVADGLLEMLPRMWSFLVRKAREEQNATFIMASDNDYLSVSDAGLSIDGVKNTSFEQINASGEISPIIDLLRKAGTGIIILMPCNEKEFILALGAQAYLIRLFKGAVHVKISSPSVMGAFYSAINGSQIPASKVSFAFGEGDDYMCCNMLADTGVYEVENLQFSSIILPSELNVSLNRIARGCLVQSLICEGIVKDVLLFDMLPYTITLLLKDDDRIIKRYDLINGPSTIPMCKTEHEISVEENKTLSFLIGSNEIIENVISESEIQHGKIEVSIDVSAYMNLNLKMKSGDNDVNINVGELIG